MHRKLSEERVRTMRVAIITIAGVSSRFNDGIPEEEKKHKAIYSEGTSKDTLLYHLLRKCSFADKIIVVGGYKYDEIKSYCEALPTDIRSKVHLIFNPHYKDLASGYSLYTAIKELESSADQVEEVLFVEGDLDIDLASFKRIVNSPSNVLTYSYEPIFANKAVVLYKDESEHYRYAFNSSHGLLTIDSPFSVILNSGQIWKFTDVSKLLSANSDFFNNSKDGTNLKIIQNYIDLCDPSSFELLGLSRWTNCNTREDYKKIKGYWEDEDEDI